MTEQEWLKCANPREMIAFLQDKATSRKLRLFAVACCRMIGDLLPTEDLNAFINVIERYADGMTSEEELRHVSECAEDTAQSIGGYLPVFAARTVATAASDASDFAFQTREYSDLVYSGTHPHQSPTTWDLQVPLLRDIFGNPFRPIALESAWLSSTVRTLAQKIYDERAFDRLPELAGALERTGCNNAEILAHLRGRGHVRGCYVVDAVLGKE
jgi:hypothetical protein